MKTKLLAIVCGLFFLSSCQQNTDKVDITTSHNETKTEAPAKLLRHVVLFNFNEEANADAIKKIEQEFIGLADKIPAIHSFEWGINNSPEGLDKGFTHCFFVSFLNEADRATYLPHPAHQAFVKFIGPYVEDVTVVDYWTQ